MYQGLYSLNVKPLSVHYSNTVETYQFNVTLVSHPGERVIPKWPPDVGFESRAGISLVFKF